MQASNDAALRNELSIPFAAQARCYGPVPALGQHSEKIRAEFAAAPANAK